MFSHKRRFPAEAIRKIRSRRSHVPKVTSPLGRVQGLYLEMQDYNILPEYLGLPDHTIRVVLEWYEVKLAEEVGLRRHYESMKRGMKPQLERDSEVDVLGALGEVAVAKGLNRYWQAEVNAKGRNGGDVGHIEVRTSSNPNHNLIVRNGDPEHKIYCLTLANTDKLFYIVGWIRGKDAKMEYYRKVLPSGSHYVVPVEDLKDPHLLKNLDWSVLTCQI